MKLTISGEIIDLQITDINLRIDGFLGKSFQVGLNPLFLVKTQDSKEIKFSDLQGSTGFFGGKSKYDQEIIAMEFKKVFDAEKAKNFPDVKISCDIIDVDYAFHSTTYHDTFLFKGGYKKHSSDTSQINKTEKNIHLTSFEDKSESEALFTILKNINVLSENWTKEKFVEKISELNTLSVNECVEKSREKFRIEYEANLEELDQARNQYRRSRPEAKGKSEEQLAKEEKEASLVEDWRRSLRS